MDKLCYTLKDKLGKDKLGPFLDGELTEEESSAVAAHLETCGQCRDALMAIRSVGTLLREDAIKAAEEADYSGLWDRVRAGSLAETVPAAPVTPVKGNDGWLERFLARLRPMLTPMEGLAVALLVVGVVYFAATLRPPMARPSVMEAATGNEAEIDSIETDSGAVMVVQSQESGVTIIILVDTENTPDEEPTT